MEENFKENWSVAENVLLLLLTQYINIETYKEQLNRRVWRHVCLAPVIFLSSATSKNCKYHYLWYLLKVCNVRKYRFNTMCCLEVWFLDRCLSFFIISSQTIAVQTPRNNDPVPFKVAEVAMLELVSNFDSREELTSIDEMNSTFSNFTGILEQKPLENATVAEAQSFLNVSCHDHNGRFVHTFTSRGE